MKIQKKETAVQVMKVSNRQTKLTTTKFIPN
uniref:Uncharacterized protein n=1 Tax=Anguilla anguilla TaxID=7936 RepID=A0A0E9UXC8_ANGAN